MQGESEKDMKEKYTLKMFMEDYEGFDFELGTIVLFDADLCRQYLLDNKTYRMMYLTEERLQKPVYDWKHDSKVITGGRITPTACNFFSSNTDTISHKISHDTNLSL